MTNIPFPETSRSSHDDAVVCVWSLEAQLGEGPVWSAADDAFYFVDILGHALHRYRPSDGERRSWTAPRRPCFLVPAQDGGLICGMEDGLYLFDPKEGRKHLIMPIEADRPGTRLNDAHLDGMGRLWFGTMDDAEKNPIGSLYSLDRTLSLRRHHNGYTISNGPVVSPDGQTLYHCDSAEGAIYAFDLDGDGALHNRRVFARIEAEGQAPDGLAMDEAGTVWAGVWGGGRLERFRADGTRLDPIMLPARNVTKAAFGGSDRRTLFITTARKGLSEAEIARQPLNGGVFCLRVDTPGLEQGVMILPELTPDVEN
ncbi:SMP-30/gluconolactonase/LRE family protein [Acetobacter estunensis]|uniref:SMP-30/gluconolactonase/LRE family protein n=1 Tax=Acetobacter estunensis TaxID=104097 RepID=A0A967B294_9PROT|nr:SMP-30/gluconolactonase/LRE family protein [Acetobacter estunensis]NHO52385.1 SMP-30/gluconolactonase/LRE family protein [Acetobacter estunensis]